MQLILDPHIQQALSKTQPLFDQVMQLQGPVYRALENRRTQRVTLNNQNYFVKQHFGIGWKEIFKNLFQLKLPVISAKNEWLAIQKLEKLGIQAPKISGYGKRGGNPAHCQSFLMTQELPPFITLEDLCKNWRESPPPFSLKMKLIRQVAHIASTLHDHGINHRDFYICHFLLDLIKYSHNCIELYLIDLHRAQIRHHTPMRWRIKDLAGLYFSCKDIGLTQRDLLRFIKLYRKQPLHIIINKETTFWWKVKARGDKLYRKHTSQ